MEADNLTTFESYIEVPVHHHYRAAALALAAAGRAPVAGIGTRAWQSS